MVYKSFLSLILLIKQNKLFALFVLLSLFAAGIFHALWLSTVPAGLSHDEVTYALSSMTFLHRGVDIAGSPFPLSLFKTTALGGISILPSILLVPWHAFLPLSQLTVRLPFVLLAFLSAWALYCIAKFLFGDKVPAAIVALFFLFQPWTLFLARFATDSPFALVFYLWGMYFLLKMQGKKLIIPFVFFLLGFFSYQGAKALYPPLIFVLLIYRVFAETKYTLSKKSASIFLGASLIVFVSFFTISYAIPGSIVHTRGGQIDILNQQYLNQTVNTQRKLTMESPMTSLFMNKITVAGFVFLEKYFTAFSPEMLFLHGDGSIIFSFVLHGLLYAIDSLFLLAGGIMLFVKKRRVFFLCAGLALIAPLASAVSIDYSYVNRSFFLLPVLMLFAGFGIYMLFQAIAAYTTKIASAILLIAVISISVINFSYFYFFQYSLTSAQYFGIGEKVLSQVILRSHQPVVVVENDPQSSYDEYALSSYSQNAQALMHNIPQTQKGIFVFSNISFLADCPKTFDQKTTYIVSYGKLCPGLPGNASYAIKNLTDAGIFFTVYNSTLCTAYSTDTYLRYHYQSDFNVATMSNKTFCERWMLQP